MAKAKTWFYRTIHGMVLVLFLPANGGSETPRLNALARSNNAFEQDIPLVTILPAEQKAAFIHLRLGWKPLASLSKDGPVTFDFEKAMDVRSRELLQAQLWVATLAAALVWQQPWEKAHWTVEGMGRLEEPGTEAVLGVGLIATAANVSFPKDATVVGSLYPDGSLGPASQIFRRIEVAAANGIRRMVVSNLQRFEISDGGNFLNVRDFAQARQVECLFVDHLAEATQILLQRGMPTPPEVHISLHYDGALFNYLDLQCKKELELLQSTIKDWPRNADRLAALPSFQQDLWREVFRNYDDGLDAYRAGLLYVTKGRLNEANAGLRALAAWNARKEGFDYKTENAKATVLRQKIVAQMNRPSMDQDELQSALVLAEQDDWLYEINARVEGSQILARQAFGSRSHASAQQKQMAQLFLQNAVGEADYQLQGLDYYPSIEQAIRRQQPVRIPSRALLWLPQFNPTYLAAAEFLTQGLKQHANEYREALLFDPRLATHARVLRDAHAEWEDEIQRKVRQQAAAQPVTVKVGFAPGPAYAPPAPPVPPPPPQGLSATARALAWVNPYCEVASLEQKYLGPGGVFEPASLEWKNQNRAALQNMLQNAEAGARYGIAFAGKAGVDPSILILIYERASHLRASPEDKNRLEALRQFWRCSLLGNLCGQLVFDGKTNIVEVAKGSPPSAKTASSAPWLAPSKEIVVSSNSPPVSAAKPVPTDAIPVTASTFSSALSTNAVARPFSIPAVPLTQEELIQMERIPGP